jgi:hypothetical protein
MITHKFFIKFIFDFLLTLNYNILAVLLYSQSIINYEPN